MDYVWLFCCCKLKRTAEIFIHVILNMKADVIHFVVILFKRTHGFNIILLATITFYSLFFLILIVWCTDMCIKAYEHVLCEAVLMFNNDNRGGDR
jgi:hypothetical protein